MAEQLSKVKVNLKESKSRGKRGRSKCMNRRRGVNNNSFAAMISEELYQPVEEIKI